MDTQSRYGYDMTTVPTAEIRRRLDAFQAGAGPGVLWPDVTEPMRVAAQSKILAVTRAVLTGSPPNPSLVAQDETEGRALGVAAFGAGIGPLLGYWIEQGIVSADPQTGVLFGRHLDHGQRRAKRLRCQLVRILRALNDSGVAPIVFKGSHTAQFFPEPGTRPAADIDLIVQDHEVRSARSGLEGVDFIQISAPHPGQTQWAAADRGREVRSLDIDHVDNPWSVDLHTSLTRNYFRGVSAGFGRLPQTCNSPWSVDGSKAKALDQPLLTAVLAHHASYDVRQVRILRLIELALVIRRGTSDGTLVWSDLADLLDSTETMPFVFPALELTELLVPGTLDPGMRARLSRSATPRARRVTRHLYDIAVDPFSPRTLDEKLMWARGSAQLLRNTLDLLWPARTAQSRRRSYVKAIRMLLRGGIRFRSTNP